jgi:hypothetical protein
MPKRGYYSRPISLAPSKKEPHPVWRVIGLIFIIVLPIVSIIASLVIVDQNQKHNWFAFPSDLILPKFIDPLIIVKILYAVIILLVLAAFALLVTFVAYKYFGPSRYGPYDVPSESFKKRKF